MEVTATNLAKMLHVSLPRVNSITKSMAIEKNEFEIRGRQKIYSPTAIKKILSQRGINYDDRKIIGFCNNKGGVGKTTIATNVSLRLANLGFKTLYIDGDSQGNGTSYFTRAYEELMQNEHKTLFDVVKGNCKVEETILKITPHLHIIPGALINDRLSKELSETRANPSGYFRKMFANLHYNYIVWDTPPALTDLTFWSLLSCDQISIITNLDYFSFEGAQMTNDMINQGKENFENYKPEVKIVINNFDIRKKSALDLIGSIKEIAPNYGSVIRVDTSIMQSQLAGNPISLSSNAYEDISALTNEIIHLEDQLKANIH